MKLALSLEASREKSRSEESLQKQWIPPSSSDVGNHYNDLMIWACFSYYKIDPLVIWLRESADENKVNTAIFKVHNDYQVPMCGSIREIITSLK